MTAATLAEIAKYAELFNQRIGQFIENAVHDTPYQLFYITDTELLIACRNYMTQHQGS